MSEKMQHLLVVEDESDIAELIRYNLMLEGFRVDTASSGEEGLKSVRIQTPDLVILDVMLPGLSGLEICRAMKGDIKLAGVPIVMVSAKGEETDIVKGLELGADDYLTKPFSPKVLLARVRAVLRRQKSQKIYSKEAVVELKALSIHPGRHEALLDGKKLDLTHSEFQILHFLAQRPGWVFTRSQIVDAIRGDNYAVTDRSIDFQMVGLRKKLGEHGEWIETVRGVGYRFKELS